MGRLRTGGRSISRNEGCLGPLDGCKLGGFTVWHNKRGDGENVTFPARPYVNGNGDRRTLSFIQGDSASLSQLRSIVLGAYRHAINAATDMGCLTVITRGRASGAPRPLFHGGCRART